MSRRTRANIYINGVNIYPELVGKIKSIRYSDSLEGESDVLELVLEDSDRQFLRGMVPARGTKVRFELVKENWTDAVEVLPVGVFEVDEITNRYPPTECTIKMNSIPNSSKTRGIEKNRSWENVSLRKIAQDVATNAGLRLFYDVENIEVTRIEQSGESDLQLLSKLCSHNGLNMKVTDGKLVIFEAARYEQKTPLFKVSYEADELTQFEGSATLNQIYGDAKVSYKGVGVADLFGGLFGKLGLGGLLEVTTGIKISGASSNILTINQKVSSQNEAERLARAKLREKNKNEWTVRLTLAGDFRFMSGNVIELVDFGMYDGDYIIDRADHTLDSGGYVVNVELHRCMRY